MAAHVEMIPRIIRDQNGETSQPWARPVDWYRSYKDDKRAASSRFAGTLVTRTWGNVTDLIAYEHVRPALVCNVMNKLKTRMYSSCYRFDVEDLPTSPADMARRFLGCTPSAFVEKLESQFHPDMNWDNWVGNGWHIDHIRALSWFDLRDLSCVRLACNYRNLRPIWADENIRKGNSLTLCGQSK